MKVSLNTVRSLVDFDLPPVDELVARVNAQLGGVEEIIELGAKYADARIVRVKSVEKHPDADKLSVCKIDDGGVVSDVDRDEDGLVQVVCGAPNVQADMWAVWLPPKSTVPSSYDDAEPFVLDARKLRGVMSYGMLAAGDELAINSDHDGIVEISQTDLPAGKNLEAGASFATTFGLDDTILDIENKMFTHRPDCFGQLGVAREIAGILGHEFTSPDWYLKQPEFAAGSGLELEIFNNAEQNSPRFMAVAIKNVTIKPSPLWIQIELVRWGSKPINNVVDLTNWIMLYTAQPTHAYDYDKLRGGKIGVRMARAGEKIRLLNDKTYELDKSDIVIADGEGAIGLAGIMGGGDSEVSADTKNIVLEVANFDMYAVRRSAMRHGLFTDALTRFNKGQSPLQCDRVMKFLLDNIGGEQASVVADAKSQESRVKNQEVSVSGQFINDRLGLEMDDESIVGLLGNVEIQVEPRDSELMTLTPPFWRTDLELPEDMVEEVGRLYGFDKLPRELPHRSTKPAPKNIRREVKQKLRRSLEKFGASEVLTYSFVHEKVLQNAEQDTSQAFKISNALSPDLQYYRLTVLPSLLDKVHMNIKSGHDEFVLYEIGKGHNKKYHGDDDDGLPSEINFLDAVYANKKPQKNSGAPYFYMQNLLRQLAADHNIELVFKPITESLDFPVTAPFDLARSAMVETTRGEFIGMVGELKDIVKNNFKLPAHCSAMTLDLAGFEQAFTAPRQTYAPLSKYPSITQDISLKVSDSVNYQSVFDEVRNHLDETVKQLEIHISPVSIYQPQDDKASKTTTLRLQFTSHEHTLTDGEISPIMDGVASKLAEKFGAERV